MRTFFLALCVLFAALPAWAGGVDLNAATAAELETLPGIGPSKAAAIVQYRTDHGPFKSVDELDNVSGIGPSTLASIRDLVSVGGGGAARASSDAPPKAAASAPPASSGSTSGCPVNINSADATRLMDLPGIGESKAAAILQYRTDNGPFASCDGLDAVNGIGEATLANLRACCSVK
ncbi:MAG: ComEA family DNA-binding protein [Myxococcota bacterium]